MDTRPNGRAQNELEALRARWVARINQHKLNALTATVRKIQAVAIDSRSSFNELSEVLRNDAALTAKVLRIANSPSYALTSERVTTLSRAAAVIGFDAIRNICITNQLLETLLDARDLSESLRNRLLDCVAASLHAAVQARMLMQGADANVREEVFLAALLQRTGEGAFWSLGGPEVKALDAAIAAPGSDAEAVVREHLGCSFRELSAALIRSWDIAVPLDPAGSGAVVCAPQVAQLANEIATLAASEGWDSPALEPLTERAAHLLNLPEDEAALRLRACGMEAEALAGHYGAGALARRMVKPAVRGVSPGAAQRTAMLSLVAPPVTWDPATQLRVLRDMTAMTVGTTDLNAVIQTAMEGIQNGIGMERTISALLNPERTALQTRLFLGTEGESWSRDFRFEIPAGRNVLSECIGEKQPLRLAAGAPARTVPPPLAKFSAGHDFLVAPIAIGARIIGLLYADRAPSGRPIGEEEFAAFTHFVQFLGLCLTAISQRR